MNRHKLLALAAMLLVPLAACDEGTPPVPVGMIDGQVSIEGQGVDGVTVTVSTGATTTTAGGGRFSFANIDGGTYTVAISNYPADASFTSTSQSATIATDGQTATVNFSGTYIRTASIIGSVTVESTGLSGVTVRISGEADQATQTDANGQYAFTQLRAGVYEVEVSDFGADVGFSSASQSVTVSVGETEAVRFDGTYVRTAGIIGRVAIEGDGLAGVTVSLIGIEPRTTTTDAAGQYAFAELRAGAYTVGISGFDTEDYEFTETSKSVTVAQGQTNNVPFDGTRLRTSGISGQVDAEGDGIAGVVVALTGAAEAMDTTDAAGQYAFSGLAAGTYTVTITGYDADAYMFEENARTFDLAHDEAAIQNFEGEHMRTAGISGQVTVEGVGIEGVMVTLTGGEAEATAMTDAEGRYAFAELRAGSYTVGISEFDTDEYTFAKTFESVTVALGQMGTATFDGTRVRTAGIRGQVSVEGAGIAGVVVALTGATEAMDTTDAAGEYAFPSLVAGTYTVTIITYDEVAYSFEEKAKTVELATGVLTIQHFKGEHTRTAGISGEVTVEDAGIAGVVVELTGAAEMMDTTDAAGQYEFSGLAAGNYTVSIQGFNAEKYAFTKTSESVTVMPAQMNTVSFEGTRLRTAGISGQVGVDGDGIPGVTVALSGDAEETDTTDATGQYAFSGLAAGNYMVKISGYDGAAFIFEETEKTVVLADAEAAIQHFNGEQTRTASISGQLFLDANEDDELDAKTEDPLRVAGLAVSLLGPDVDELSNVLTDSTGMFMFDSLRAGTYRVLLRSEAFDPRVLPAGWPEGVVPGGDAEGYSVKIEPSGIVIQNLPFDITIQTITMQAMMGDGNGNTGAMVEGVEIDLYPTLASANARRNQIGNTVMTNATGTATFKFLRALDTSPRGGRDNVVFAQVAKLPHADLVLTDIEALELTYSARSPMSVAGKAVQMLNRRSAVQFEVKNIKTEIGGGEGQEGWSSELRTDVTSKGFQSPTASDKSGKSTFSDLHQRRDLPVKYYIRLAASQPKALGEAFMGTPKPSDDVAKAKMELLKVGDSKTAKAEPLLVYEHDGLVMPDSIVDLGVLEVKWITQTLVVGVHYERTQVTGYDANIVDGDRRPSETGAAAVDVALQTVEDDGTLVDWEYPEDAKPTGGTAIPRSPKPSGTTDAGLVFFYDLPADKEFVVTASTDDPRKIYGYSDVDTFLGSKRETRSRGKASSGAFGTQSGTGPLVYICPHSPEPSSEVDRHAGCSTFAYGFTNGRVDVSVQTRDYGSAGGPVTTFSSEGKDSVTVRLRPLPEFVLGSKRSRTATANGKSCTEEITGTETTCTNGTLNFKNVEGGRYELSVISNSAWVGSVLGSTLKTDTITLFSLLDTDGTDQKNSPINKFQVTYLKTKITGTVANDLNAGTLDKGNGIVSRRETQEGATLNIKRVIGRTFRQVAQVKTKADGTFTSPYLPEGSYVVEGESTDDYELRANNTSPTNRSGTLTTTARVAGRTINSGTPGTAGSLPRWSYGDHDRTSVTTVPAGTALVVLDHQADADFIVLFKDGALSGRVTQPDDFGKDADAGDSDDNPDPYAGLTVRLQRCGAVPDIATALTSAPSNLGYERCTNFDESFEPKSTTTNSNGAYSFSGLKEGWYAVSLDLTGVNHSSSATDIASYLRLLQGPADSDAFRTIHVKRTPAT